ncbi:hypothetical protein [Asticcacaulis sp. YBE204]|uniref:hypothetical protein n=1 Tax=Asticcacaulis sp. YBE204 TaxID=1282363 RepID=UPI0003C40729|nr:hypothetical protein [Asticcacaulis sp. YBE204]ESQ81212.1 hypothetical protein AEYBE204_02435 [Asticcacaulis sp. YBE204]
MDDMLLWTLVSAVATVMTALTGVIFWLLSQHNQAKTEKAEFYVEFTRRYNSSDMHDALYRLMQHYTQNPDNFVELYLSEFLSHTQKGFEIERSRRIVSRYFNDIAEMRQNKLIDRKLARMLCNFQGLNIYYNVVVPMSRARYGNSKTRERIYAALRAIRPHFDDGGFGLSIAPGTTKAS